MVLKVEDVMVEDVITVNSDAGDGGRGAHE